jgi:hypothetical protein
VKEPEKVDKKAKHGDLEFEGLAKVSDVDELFSDENDRYELRRKDYRQSLKFEQHRE